MCISKYPWRQTCASYLFIKFNNGNLIVLYVPTTVANFESIELGSHTLETQQKTTVKVQGWSIR